MALPVHVHQGTRVWHQRLIDISLQGLSTDQPEGWNASENEPFTLVIDFEEDSTLVLQASMRYARAGRMGFMLQHVGRDNIEPLKAVMAAHLDIVELEDELARLI